MPLLTTLAGAALKAYGFSLGVAASNYVATLSSATSDFTRGITTDSAGNIYVAGRAVTGGQQSGLFARLNSGASAISFQVAANTVSATADYFGLASDGTSFYTVGSQTSAGNLVKYNNSGVIQWQRRITPNANAIQVNSVAVDTAGNIIIGGYSWSGAGYYHMAIGKYNASGTYQGGNSIFTGANNFGYAVATDSTNAAYVLGHGTSGSGALIIKNNAAGTTLWTANVYASGQNHTFWAATCDSGNNLLSMGTYGDTGGTFVLKQNSAGAIQWQRLLAVGSGQFQSGIAVDATGAVYVLTSGSHIIKYNSAGTIQWQRSFTRTSGTTQLTAIRIDGDNFVITGGTDTTSGDIVLAKLPIDGTKTGTYTIGSSNFVYAASSLSDTAASLSAFLGNSSSGNVFNDNAGTLTATTTALTLAKSA
jgi:hypothetical protein